MTREEAIELLCYGDWLNVISEHIGKQDTERIAKAMCIVGKALRPVSRERVETVWRGEWIAVREAVGGYKCSRCKAEAVLDCNDEFVLDNFCPRCGAAMTDEAVQMVIERMEALKDGNTD